MSKIIGIKSKDIEEVLKGITRQYLVGNLKRPQELEFIKDEHLEIGITDYDTYTTEDVHFHTDAFEYQYMISGWTKYMDVSTGEEFEFKKGDFYCIEKNVIYAQKSKKGTRILFIKVPSINDKQLVEINDVVNEWYKEGLKTIRTDYAHEVDMPSANSMKPAAAVAIIDDNRILMLRRSDNGKWTLPGGTMELNESLVDCAIREVQEETGLEVEVKDIIGTYTDPNIRIEYSDGEVRREFTIVYFGTSKSSDIIIDEESSAYAWIPIVDVKKYPMAESQKKRIDDVINFYNAGEKRMG